MTAKLKTYLIYFGIAFLLLSLTLIALQFYTGPTFFRIIFPVVIVMLLTPRPHVVKNKSGNQYGLKSIFSNKIIQIK